MKKGDEKNLASPGPKGPTNDTSRTRGSKLAVPLRKKDAAVERMDDELCTIDLWDNLVNEHWDIRDALKHGKTGGHEDPSKDKIQRQREESPKKAKIRSEELEGEPPQCETNIYIDARK